MNARAVLFCALIPFGAAAWAQKSGGAPEQLGQVSFENSCLPAAQPAFERGVALLHSFWFSQSEREFQEALARDSDCAIAGWGIAAALIGNTSAPGPNPAQAGGAKEPLERSRARSRKTE